MISSMVATIRGLLAPDHRLSCSTRLWRTGLAELNRRGGGRRESGAFLLGRRHGLLRRIEQFVYYDDLDPHSLDSGIVTLDGDCFGTLWSLCRTSDLSVVADVHTHPGAGYQSMTDRENPMIAVAGHIALIVPNLAENLVGPAEIGVYEYLGKHEWRPYSGKEASRFFYMGIWG